MDEVAWTKAADRSGFKYTWATEHHFLEEYSHLSANESFLAYLAGVTENIHLGSGIINITPPVNHPARVAERVAMIDHLSGGRFEFGTGRGSSTTEQAGFGITDPDLTKAMFDEALPQIVRMWTETDYSFDGEFFSMPAAQRAAQALHQAPPAAVGRRRQPRHLREGGPDGPRRPLLRHLQPRGAQAPDRHLQEQHRRRRAGRAATSTTTSW